MNCFDYQQGLEPCWYFYAISDNKIICDYTTMIYKNLFAKYTLRKIMRLSVPTTDIIESAFVTVFLALVVCTSLGSFHS